MAILFAWAIAQALLLIGDLNAIAALCTNFFLIVYFLINAACFALKLAGVPNFRPRFKYFTAWTALLGAILSLAIALYLDWIMVSARAGCVCVCVLGVDFAVSLSLSLLLLARSLSSSSSSLSSTSHTTHRPLSSSSSPSHTVVIDLDRSSVLRRIVHLFLYPSQAMG